MVAAGAERGFLQRKRPNRRIQHQPLKPGAYINAGGFHSALDLYLISYDGDSPQRMCRHCRRYSWPGHRSLGPRLHGRRTDHSFTVDCCGHETRRPLAQVDHCRTGSGHDPWDFHLRRWTGSGMVYQFDSSTPLYLVQPPQHYQLDQNKTISGKAGQYGIHRVGRIGLAILDHGDVFEFRLQ